MELLQKIFAVIGDLTWGQSLIPVLVIFGLFFTFASKFVQFQFFKRMFGVLFKNGDGAGKDAISGRLFCFR